MREFGVKRILVPTDTSEPSRVALEYAHLFAGRFGAEMILLYADPLAYPLDTFTGGLAPYVAAGPEDFGLLEKEVRAYAEPTLGSKGYEIAVIGGQPVPMILRQAAECSADLIVMATHGLRGWRRTLLGSVTEGVLHGARCPVLSISRSDRNPRREEPDVTRIVCPVNFTEIARDALGTASALAKKFNAELVVVHVVEGDVAVDQENEEQRVRQWSGREAPDRTVFRQLVVHGGAAERILDCVEDLEADLLVIGAQRKLMRDATVIGTTTERIVRFSRAPVLTVVREAAAAEKVA